MSAASKRMGIEGKDNKAFITLKLCDANVGWVAPRCSSPALLFPFCVPPLNTSIVCPSNFVQTAAFDC